ncbi:MAG: NAAT family transporter [Bacteroidetes bacterium]|nr:NAAT family transporter [Bacteroidota bacterium]
MSDVSTYIKIFIAIFVLVNPLEGISMFLSKTANVDPDIKSKIVKKTAVSVFIVLLISLFFGKYVLTLFGIGIPSFTVAGGIIIFLIALDMVIGKSDSGEKSLPSDPNKNPEDIAVVPLAIPLLAGPGAISSIILYGSSSSGILEDVILVLIIFVVAVAVWLSLNAATKMEKALHPIGVKILTKISGLLVAAIAVELIHSGIVSLFKMS